MKLRRGFPLVFRVIYFLLLGAVCVARYFALFVLPSNDGGPVSPWDGMPFFLELVVSHLIVLPLCLLLWALGFRQIRARKKALIIGFLIIDWPVLLLLCFAGISFLLHHKP